MPGPGTVLPDCTHMPELGAGLKERGYGDSAVGAIMGGNWMRVLKNVVA